MAYETPAGLLYASTHEWVTTEGDELTIGISDYAQQALGDVVFVELPEVGRTLEQGDAFGVVESVKAVSDLFSPVSGEVIEANEALSDRPETLNSDPYGEGWIVKIRLGDPTEPERLRDADSYRQLIKAG